jgi:hypothetical protein
VFNAAQATERRGDTMTIRTIALNRIKRNIDDLERTERALICSEVWLRNFRKWPLLANAIEELEAFVAVLEADKEEVTP